MNFAEIPASSVLVRLDSGTLLAVPVGNPLEQAARRWLHGKAEPGDGEALRAWLAAHPQYEIARVPAPEEAPAPVPLPVRGQQELWTAA